MQNASEVLVDKASAPSSPPTCCFWWEITRGPHENVVLTLCLHEDAGANAVREGLKVGRQKRCWMRLLKDLEVSSVHAEFRLASGKDDDDDTTKQADDNDKRLRAVREQVVLCDLNSTNGTKLNGEPLVPRQVYALANQDLIHFGKTVVRFRVASSIRSAEEGADAAAASQVGGRDESYGAVSSPDDENGQDRQQVQEEQLAVDLTEDGGGEPSACHKVDAKSGDRTEPPAPVDRADQDDVGSTEPTTTAHSSSSAGEGRFTTRDDDVFEAPSISHVAQLPARTASSSSPSASASAMMCMICGQWLGHLDVLEQQLHINGCLDGRNQVAENWLLPPQQQHSASGRTDNHNQTQTKKRKRGRGAATTTTTTIEDDEVTMALALSRSMANKEQEVDMDMALLSGELAQIDTQMAKLAKKREALLKKMAKLEKTKAKVRKSAVIPPAEARVLLDLFRVLQLLFPEVRRVAMEDITCSPAEFKRARLVASKYAPQVKTGLDSGRLWRLPSMWLRASQQLFGHTERDLYSNSILLPFVHIEAEKKDENCESEEEAHTTSTAKEIERQEQDEIDVPDSIKRVFPDWIENLAFLRQQSVEDLKDALYEMIEQRNDRLLRHELEGEDDTLFASRSGKRVDEEEACAFFENVIEELIRAKEGAAAGGGRGRGEDPEASGSAENVVIIVDSDDDSDDREELTEDTNAAVDAQDEALVAAGARLPVPESQQDQAAAPLSQVIEIRAIDTAMTQMQDTTPTAAHPEHLIETSTATAACETQSPSSGELDAGVPNAPEHLVVGSVDASSSELGNGSSSPQTATTTDTSAGGGGTAPSNNDGQEDVEVLLLGALKAHQVFYEMVLLLQPLDATDFVIYATQVAKIKCSKRAVLEFFDRHGITFKQN